MVVLYLSGILVEIYFNIKDKVATRLNPFDQSGFNMVTNFKINSYILLLLVMGTLPVLVPGILVNFLCMLNICGHFYSVDICCPPYP